MIRLLILDVPEFAPVAAAAAEVGNVTRRVGDYTEIESAGPLVVERSHAGVRKAVWFSAIAGLQGGSVVRYDVDQLRIEAA